MVITGLKCYSAISKPPIFGAVGLMDKHSWTLFARHRWCGARLWWEARWWANKGGV